MQYPKAKQTYLSLAVASACAALVTPGVTFAQSTAGASLSPAGAEVQTVVVTGLRASLQSSLNLKRNSDGLVDGIVAEDIGKFPDTNLAEALQRISGVSIDRNNGEGQKVTVRGVGPDFNMVLFNGRQMATSNLGDLNGRSFDFANLASEAVSQIQVYKTSRADSPTGGIGATLNVMTARPFARPGLVSSIGVKAVHDTSNNNLPGDVKDSKKVTPEISGIYSNTSADGRFGVAVSGSYQERNSGSNQAAVSSGWHGPFRGDENNWGTIPQPGTPGAAGITNRPAPNDIYSVPQNLNYSMTGIKRQRTNGQLTLQFAPIKELVTTLDYTYSENKIQTKRNDISAWFNFGPSTSTWSPGPVSGPLVYTEIINPANSDIAMGAADFATKTQNNAIGINLAWRATSDLKLEFDAHKSTAESKADSPFGSNNTLGSASFSRGTTSADFTKDFPVLSIEGADFVKARQQVTGSTFQNGYMKGEVAQAQVSGRWKVREASQLNFGLAATKVDNRSAFSNQQRDTWGGATSPADYPSTVWHADTVRQYFDQIDGSDSTKLFNQFYTFNFAQVRQLAANASGLPNLYLPKTTYDTDRRTGEKTRSGFLQFNTDWNTAMPIHTGIGLRYEKTDVSSTALVPSATSITMVSANEFSVGFGAPTFTTLGGSYHHLLPSLDFDIDVRKDVKLRASYGETIGRPRYDQIQGGQTLDQLARVNGGTGSQGNPALKPVKSKNLDLSAEWYYTKSSFASLGVFHKNLKDYAGQSTFTAQPFALHTPVGGALWNQAAASGCGTDAVCIRNFIFRNHPTAPGVTRGKDDDTGNATGTIVGQPSDPIANFRINSFSNAKDASLHGAEVNLQHMFGNSGFGVQANYTWVHSGLKYDNASQGEQFALLGLSNSANLVGIFENSKWTARAAYNWRGEFLSSTFDGYGPNPNYTEPFGQLDVSVTYAYNDKLSFQVEAINLTNETQRVHGRTKTQVLYATQAGPRYMIGARYKF
ncbi:TonB-dependent receptor [Massilia eurypsychrophila]|uniref:TonB-dependent receptor n=1 Tax=Massilia eurypsychrophila TaxID=1485217 RepID=A0A2G8TBZ9_9BURK|nr:TonB-dependent receptor [Massilia eurypsychrophila]PIL43552.1 TonB-dependent receptor [Massilia eurypsychrophila]